MKERHYIILSMNPGYDQWHVIYNPPVIDGVYRADKVFRFVSGKGLNVARVLKNLGFEGYVCVNIIGGGTGEIISRRSKEEGICCREFRISEESRINTCVMMEYSHESVSYNEPGPKLSRDEVKQFKDYLSVQLRKERDCDVVISGAPCRGITEDDFRDILSLITAEGNELIVDVSGRWLQIAAEFPLRLLKVNREEFKEAFYMDAFIFDHDLKRFKTQKRINDLIVTDGKNGCVVLCKDGRCFYGGVRGVAGGSYPVGSGDSFLAGYLTRYAQGAGIKECVRYANACGLANTYEYGPGVFDRFAVEAQLGHINLYEKGGSVL